MKILLIEDNVRLAERVSHYLGKSFVVETAETGDAGLAKAMKDTFDVIVLDLNLPDIHGTEVCLSLRKRNIDTPILVLSGLKDIETRVSLLDYGADDYLVKPCDPRELTARIHALLRRQKRGFDQHIIIVKDLIIDVNSRQVERAGKPIVLRRKEFDILEYLASNQGKALSREMILNHAWDGAKGGWYNTVDVHIKHLRDKIDTPFDSHLIKTIYGVGYMVDNST